jgi:hypothetical protein
MANITVSTSSNFDDAGNLGLLNGENITIQSDALLTINSDVRWGQNAAVPYVITITQGKLLIDGSQTWWIPYDAATGNVPSLGTRGTPDVTRSGSNVGEFLGVWTALGVAPSTAGGAMPATGFVKLRTKSATLADNDVLTFANGATITINSATGGQRGWIHFVGREGVSSTTGYCTVPRLGEFQTTGDWFELGTSNGASGQTFQHYVADYCPALQVETGSGTGIYDWWGYAPSAEFTATNIATDERGRFFTCTAAGVITFGGATFGKLPPNGAKIRVPNIHVSSTTSANYAANTFTTTVANRFAFVSSGGVIDIANMCNNGSVNSSDAPLYRIVNSCASDGAWFEHSGAAPPINVSQVRFDNTAAARVITGTNIASYVLLYCFDAEFKNCASFQSTGAGTATGAYNLSNITGLILDGCVVLNGKTIDPIVINYCNGVTIKDCYFSGNPTNNIVSMTGNTDVSITNLRLSARNIDTATAANYGVSITNCVNVLVDTVTIWQTAVAPIFGIIYALSQTKNIRIRNIGTRASPIALGAASRNAVWLRNSTDIVVSKVYATAGNQTVDSAISSANCDNLVVSDVGDPSATTGQSLWFAATNTTFVKRSSTGGSKIYQNTYANGRTINTFTAFGSHFFEEEVSSTEIQLTVNAGVEKSSYASSLDSYTDDVGTILRDGTNGLLLRTLNDQVTWAWSYWIRGLTGFANTNAVLSGTNTGNFEITYDIDKGTGFSGTFKTATGANLSAETGVLPSGVRLKVRARCSTANAANVLRSIGIYGVTSTSDITSNPYPYNEPLVYVTGIVSGSLAAVFKNSDGKRLDTKAGTTEIKMYPEWFSNTTCTLRVRKPGYDAVSSEFNLTENGLAYPVSQVDNTIANTNPGSLGITVTNHGASPVTWNSKQYSITITVTDSSTPAQIAQWISWHTAQDSFSLNNGFHNTAWPSMIIPAGTSFETQRGTLFGSAGASLKGVRIIDGSGNGIAGFTRFQADDGTYFQPPVSATFELTNLKNNTEVRVYKVSDMSELAGQENVTTGTFSYSYIWSTDIPILVSIVSIGYQNLQLNSTLTATGTSIPISQVIDRQYLNP